MSIPYRISEMFTDLLGISDSDPVHGDRITVEEITNRLQERGFGVIAVLLSIPSAIPGCPPPLPSMFALPMAVIAIQMMLGYHAPSLPGFITRRSVVRGKLKKMLLQSKKYLQKIDPVVKPRLLKLTSAKAERVLGFFMLLFSISVLIPLPLTNTVPSIGIILIGIAIVSRDGFLAVAGVVSGTVWIAGLLLLSQHLLEWAVG